MRRLLALCVGITALSLISIDTLSAQTRPKIDDLLKDLGSKDAKTKITALGHVGDYAAVKLAYAQKALPQMREILAKDTDPKVRSAALVALGKTEAESKEYVANMLKYLKEDKDYGVQAKALELLGNYQQEAAIAIKPLKERLEELREANKDQDPGNIRTGILNTMVTINQNLGTSTSIEALEEDKAVSVKLTAVNRLNQIGQNGGAKDAPKVLFKTYEESLKAGPTPELRRAILGALASIRADVKDFRPLLTETLKKDKDAGVITGVIAALGRAGEVDKETATLVLDAQKNVTAALPKDGGDPNGQRRAMYDGLVKLGIDSKLVVPALLNALKVERDLGARAGLLGGLGSLGEGAKSSFSTLSQLHKAGTTVGAKDANDPGELRRLVVDTVTKIGADPKDVVPLLTSSASTDKNLTVRMTAVKALGEIGAPAKSALAVLKKMQTLPKNPTEGDKELAKAAKEAADKIEGK